jgi:replicative DNA helicase
VQWITNAVTGEAETGVSTGLPQLDDAVGKLRPGELVLLGGRPGSGKTSIAQNIAFNAASAGVGVFFASLEMLQADIGVRFLARGLADRGVRIPYSRMLSGRVSEDEHRAVVEEAKRQQGLPLMMAERNVRATSVLRAAVRRARQAMADTASPLGLVVVDYLQLLQPDQGGGTYDRVSAASDACKDLAMELGVPVLALAQLSRSVEHRDPPVPQMSDLRDSGRLEEDAGTVIFAYREAYYLQRRIEACENDEELMSMRMRLSTLLSAYFDRDAPDVVRDMTMSDWMTALQPYPQWAIERACRWWKSVDNPDRRKRPLEGDIVEAVRRHMRGVHMVPDLLRMLERGDFTQGDRP